MIDRRWANPFIDADAQASKGNATHPSSQKTNLHSADKNKKRRRDMGLASAAKNARGMLQRKILAIR
jgi:hypothetical protein